MTLYIGRESSKVGFLLLFCALHLLAFSNFEKATNCACLLLLVTDFLPFGFEKLWKRICAEVVTEINLLAANWKYLLAGLVGQVIQFEILQPLCGFGLL